MFVLTIQLGSIPTIAPVHLYYNYNRENGSIIMHATQTVCSQSSYNIHTRAVLLQGWYGHLMVLYKTNLIGSLGHHQNMSFQSFLRISSTAHILKYKMNIFLNVFKCNWVTGSPPKFDTLLASWYTTYTQSFIISHSSCAEQYGDCIHTHILTHSHTIESIQV